MTNLIAQSIDNGIMILAAALLLWYYFKPGTKQLYKKKWVLAVFILLILYNVAEFTLAGREYLAARLPSRESVGKTMQNSGQIVAKNFMFSSADGYQVLIPSGYKYVASQAGGLSLTATRDSSAFIVLKMQDPASLDRIMDDALVAMQKRNATFRVDGRRKMRLDGAEAVRMDCRVTRNNVPAKIILVLCQKGNLLFQLTFSCPQDLFAELQAEYEEILASFKIN